MAKAIRRAWERGTMELVLFAGLFALPLAIHLLALILT
jgi:hypothetical protein